MWSTRWKSLSTKARKFHRAGERLLEGLGYVLPVLTRLLTLGVVQSGAVESGQVLVVGAGAIPAVQSLAELRIEPRVHVPDGLKHPVRHVHVLDVPPERPEHIPLDTQVRLEFRVSEHGPDTLMEPVVLHELVVETERDGETARDRTWAESQFGELRHIGGLDPEGILVVEADFTERSDFSNRQIPLWYLRLRGPRILVMCLDLLLGGGPDAVFDAAAVTAASQHFEPDVSTEQVPGVEFIQNPAHVGVWDAVLHGPQVHVGERRLRDGGDYTGHKGEVNWAGCRRSQCRGDGGGRPVA